MRISARCDYACRAILELSLHWPNRDPVRIQQISERQDIPERYLVQILIQLKRLGFVDSARGKEGGYNLLRSPEDIRLGEVIRSISGPFLPMSESAISADAVFLGIWNKVEGVMEDILHNISFADICDSVRRKDKTIIYQI